MACPRPKRLLLGCLIFLLITVSTAVLAGEAGCNAKTADSPVTLNAATDNPSTAGLQAYIDPKTGELADQPPAAEAAAADGTAAQSQPELVEEILPDGSARLHLDERFQTSLQAEVKNGQLVTCHGDSDQHDQP